MPATRKPLPRPCPLCGRSYGTVKIDFSEHKRTIRIHIGHYSKFLYKNKRGISGKKSKNRGKVFCNFKIPRKLGNFFFSSDESMSSFFEAVRNDGWNVVPEYEEFIKEMYNKFGYIQGYIPHEKVWMDLARHGHIDQDLVLNVIS